VKNADKSHILARDAEVRNISGLKFGFINGIVTEKGGTNKGIPRNNPDQYLAMANKLKSVDFLCTHESPLMPDLWVKPVGPGPLTAQMAIEITRPAISLSGHLHGRVITKQIGKTMAIRIDSSQAQRQFVTIETQKKMITIWLEDHLLQQLIF
jgi:Icc-related predicted phosphoesterase